MFDIPKGILKQPGALTKLFWFIGSNPVAFVPLVTLAAMFVLWWYAGRDPDPGMTAPRSSAIAASASAAGKAEIGHEKAPVVVEEKIGRLDVTVDEPAPVGVGEPVGGLSADRSRLLRAEQTTGVQQGPQTPAPEVLQHKIGNAVLVAPVVYVQDVAVVQRGGQSRLGLELAEKRGIACQRRVKKLDCDAPTKPRVVGGEDLGRSTGADDGK